MNFELGKALLSLLFYTDNPYFYTPFFPKFYSYFFVEEHLKACLYVFMNIGKKSRYTF